MTPDTMLIQSLVKKRIQQAAKHNNTFQIVVQIPRLDIFDYFMTQTLKVALQLKVDKNAIDNSPKFAAAMLGENLGFYNSHSKIMNGNDSILTCSSLEPINIYNLSKLCLEHSLSDAICNRLDCFPEQFTNITSNLVGAWCVINCIVGFCGNLLTVLAIPYAKGRKW